MERNQIPNNPRRTGAPAHVTSALVQTDNSTNLLNQARLANEEEAREEEELNEWIEEWERRDQNARHHWSSREEWNAYIACVLRAEEDDGVPEEERTQVWDRKGDNSSVLKTVDVAALTSDQPECCICQEAVRDSTARRLACGHVFHLECIKSWLNEKNTCPICRKVFALARIPNFRVLPIFLPERRGRPHQHETDDHEGLATVDPPFRDEAGEQTSQLEAGQLRNERQHPRQRLELPPPILNRESGRSRRDDRIRIRPGDGGIPRRGGRYPRDAQELALLQELTSATRLRGRTSFCPDDSPRSRPGYGGIPPRNRRETRDFRESSTRHTQELPPPQDITDEANTGRDDPPSPSVTDPFRNRDARRGWF